jgi:sec-independent protein translocase protein TatB
MFDLDLSKMILVGAVALVVVGPKELPPVLRALARTLAKLRRVQASMRAAVHTLVADAGLDSVDRELEGLGKTMRVNIALDPATAMRGSLLSSESSGARLEAEEPQFVSPEMQAYLAPSTEEPTGAPASGEDRRGGISNHSRLADQVQRPGTGGADLLKVREKAVVSQVMVKPASR